MVLSSRELRGSVRCYSRSPGSARHSPGNPSLTAWLGDGLTVWVVKKICIHPAPGLQTLPMASNLFMKHNVTERP